MNDYMVRAASANGEVRAFAAVTAETAESARAFHNTSKVVTAALGRLLTAGAMIGYMLKGQDKLTLQIRSDGPVEGLTVTADSNGHVKGYALEPAVSLPIREKDGKLDVGGIVGKGYLQVIKDQGLKDPYIGETELVNGEIAEDLTYYFAASEQVPSAVGLGVLVNSGGAVMTSGGFIVQMLPGAGENSISRVEENLKNIRSVTDVLKEGKTPEDLIRILLNGLEPDIYEPVPVSFRCDCSRERVSKVLISLGKKELQKLIDEGETTELKCEFCGKKYAFSVEELRELMASLSS